MQRDSRSHLARALLVLTLLALASPALASSGGGGLPWEAPLQQIQ
ncbi:conjugal transfer protein TrbC, partial [Mesorhizobium sp. M00.F.Ca.ET.149.01.1.1]